MIILLSPAKTFNKALCPYASEPVFYEEAKYLVKKLKKRSLTSLQESMHLSKRLATSVKNDYLCFDTRKTAAIHGYYGHQFRHFDVDSLEEKGLNHRIKSIYMLSGLYGLVNAYDGISPYRLEMKDHTIMNLYQFWQPKLADYLTKAFDQDIIYNLCSDEYGKLVRDLDHVISIQFLNQRHDELTIHAMEAKRMRGLFARHLVMHPHDDVKSIVIDDYHFQENLSNQHTYTYVRIRT